MRRPRKIRELHHLWTLPFPPATGARLYQAARLPTPSLGTTHQLWDARQEATVHSQGEAPETKSLGNSLMVLHLMYHFTGWCSPLKSSGGFSFSSFDCKSMKQAVTVRYGYSLDHASVLLSWSSHTAPFQLLLLCIQCKPACNVLRSPRSWGSIMAAFTHQH